MQLQYVLTMTREFAFAFSKMKLALVLQTLAIFTVTTLVRCAPVENQSNEIAERDAAEENPYCVEFYEDTYRVGEMAVMCIQFKTCWPGKIAPLNTSTLYIDWGFRTGASLQSGFIRLTFMTE